MQKRANTRNKKYRSKKKKNMLETNVDKRNYVACIRCTVDLKWLTVCAIGKEK